MSHFAYSDRNANQPLYNLLKRAIDWVNSMTPDYRHVIWVVGDGRSGTTWAANLLNYHQRYQYLYEPFHPHASALMSRFTPFQYLRPESSDDYYLDLARQVFRGEFERFDSGCRPLRLRYRGLLVKDVFANLLLRWVNDHFPHVRKVMVLRHPCAVALSKMKIKEWFWPTDPGTLLAQNNLHEDFLYCFEDIIRQAGSVLQKHIVIWAVVHYVPLKQLSQEDLHLLFYENLCVDPERELRSLFSFVGDDLGDTPLDMSLLAQYKTPSQTCRTHSAIYHQKSLIHGWKEELEPVQIDEAIRTLSHFGLHQIYDTSVMPHCGAALRMLRESNS